MLLDPRLLTFKMVPVISQLALMGIEFMELPTHVELEVVGLSPLGMLIKMEEPTLRTDAVVRFKVNTVAWLMVFMVENTEADVSVLVLAVNVTVPVEKGDPFLE